MVSSARGGAAAVADAAAVVEQIGVEVGVADAVGGGLDLAEVDAEVARALAHGGGGEDLRSPSPAVRAERCRRALLDALRCGLRRRSGRTAVGCWRRSASAVALVGISSSCAGGRDDRAVGERLLVAWLSAATVVVALGLDLDQHAADRDLVADFAGQLGHRARDRRFHFDRRLVGHHVGELLVFLDAVADLDVPRDDFGLGNAFADVGQLELIGRHYASMHLLERILEPDRAGEIDPFVGVRVGRVPAGDAHDRRLEMVEAALLDQRGQFGAEARGAGRFLDDQAAAGLLHRFLDRLDVERDQGAQVDDLGVDAIFLDRGERDMDHRAVGQHGQRLARADDRRLAERDGVMAVGHRRCWRAWPRA